jgi:hypothetical protein
MNFDSKLVWPAVDVPEKSKNRIPEKGTEKEEREREKSGKGGKGRGGRRVKGRRKGRTYS